MSLIYVLLTRYACHRVRGRQRRNNSEFVTTLTLLMAIAAPARAGLK
jgi:hypothetical protein